MKLNLILATAAAGLTIAAISAQAQTTETRTHSGSDGHGGSDSISQTTEITLPPPSGPLLAMYDWAMQSSNAYIAINDPSKYSHPKPKPLWNHDGQAFVGYVRP